MSYPPASWHVMPSGLLGRPLTAVKRTTGVIPSPLDNEPKTHANDALGLQIAIERFPRRIRRRIGRQEGSVERSATTKPHRWAIPRITVG